MEATEFETDSLLKLLSDALRRGPGSPEWREAITRFADADGPGADEYRLLLRARERLESGREYRTVRAGPEFTREVFANLGNLSSERPGTPRPAILIGLLCLVVLLIAGGVFLLSVFNARPSAELTQLQNQLFSSPKQQWSFDQRVPDDLKATGTLNLAVRDGGIRVASTPTTLPAEGDVAVTNPIDVSAGACFEAQMHYQAGDTSLSLIASDHPPTELKNSHSIVVLADIGGVRCFVNGTSTPAHPITDGTHIARIKFLNSVASAEIDGHLVWSGPRPFGTQVYPALAWTKSAKPQNEASIRSLSVLVP